MQTSPERRSPQNPRVPLDDVLVQLFPEGFDESFEADAVDLGRGGLAMRAPLLPDIGSTLRCCFTSPEGLPVDADCEVVWAEDSGPSEGRFGLRFTQLPEDSADAIHRIVDEWMALVGEPELDEPELATLHLAGVKSPFVGTVGHRAGDALLVEQELPFLRIGTGVSEDGERQGRLASVDLRVDDDTPRLVLTVLYEDSSPGVEEAEEDAAQFDDAAQFEDAAPSLPEAAELEADRTFRQDAPPVMEEAPAEPVPVAVAAAGAPASPVFSERTPSPDDQDASLDDDGWARSITPAGELRALLERLGPRAKALRALGRTKLATLRTKLSPALKAIWAKIVLATLDLKKKHLPAWRSGAGRVLARLRAFGLALLSKRRGAAQETRRPRRKTTSPPRVTRDPRQAVSAPIPSPRRTKNRRRAALLSGLVVLGGATAWALSGDEQAAADTPAPIRQAAAAPAPSSPVPPAVDVRSPYAEPEIADPEAGDQAEPETPAEAAPAPETAAGRMASPTFPSIASGPGAATPSSDHFGADEVARARDFTLRMSRRVEGLRGEALPDGFRVDVDGSLSLDRAGPIAAAHPAVERATILNRGDHAELRVRFVSGRHPDYRVEARGPAIVVSIGR